MTAIITSKRAEQTSGERFARVIEYSVAAFLTAAAGSMGETGLENIAALEVHE